MHHEIDLDVPVGDGFAFLVGVIFEGGSAAAFPMLDRIEAESEQVGKPGLSQIETLTDILDVNLRRNGDLVALLLPGEKSLDLIKRLL